MKLRYGTRSGRSCRSEGLPRGTGLSLEKVIVYISVPEICGIFPR